MTPQHDASPRERWVLNEASDLLGSLNAGLLAQGWQCALTGEVLYTGRGKQLDLVAVPDGKLAVDGARVTEVIVSLLAGQRRVDSPRGCLFWVDGRLVNLRVWDECPRAG